MKGTPGRNQTEGTNKRNDRSAWTKMCKKGGDNCARKGGADNRTQVKHMKASSGRDARKYRTLGEKQVTRINTNTRYQ